MILRSPQLSRPLRLPSLFILLLFFSPVSADDAAFDCLLTVDSLKYDLTSLGGEHVISRTRETPPTSMVDTVRFDLCADLKVQDGVAERDQCPTGTRVCLTKINKKDNESDRTVAVVPIVQTASLNPGYTPLSKPKGLSLILHGPSYPHPSNSTPTPQSLKLTLLCTPESSDPKFTSYDGSQLQLEWSSKAGCPFKGDNGEHKGGGEKERVGSGIGWFFLVLLLAFLGYFGLGAYYNYSTYGASGVDLIPHRDFWKEVPYMLNDVISHLCSTVRPRHSSSRGGYISV